jgi:D-alanyl-D-alanine carboxypeptidase/D-alanyl-D-alanine-endopeptidase (penicillin-binding protein 4)
MVSGTKSTRAIRAIALITLAGCGGVRTEPLEPARSPRSQLAWSIDSMIDAPQFRNAHFGVLIVDPVRGDTLYSRNAGKLFMPASNMKIITGSVALAQLGAEYRFRTTFVGDAPVTAGVLRGNLIIEGRGDPSLSDGMRRDTTLPPELRPNAMTAMKEIADSLVARGIKRIDGRLLRGRDIFPDSPWGYAWGYDQFEFPYSAGVDELFFNEGFTRVLVRAGSRPGDPPTATTSPARTFPAIRVFATTVARPVPGDSIRPRLTIEHDTIGPGMMLGGTIAVGDSANLSITYRDQNAAYLAALREALQERGITVGGAALPAGSRADTLFTVYSPPLREVLKRFEKPSQNQIGEILLKTLALERTDTGTAQRGRAVIRDQLIAWGVDSMGFVVRDGSGLSRHDYLTPETVVRVLARMRSDSAFQVFYDALPIMGVDGTIERRLRGTAAAGNIRAKTGSVDRARSISGYVTTADGTQLIFSLLSNNWTAPVRNVDEVHNAIALRLATLRLSP